MYLILSFIFKKQYGHISSSFFNLIFVKADKNCLNEHLIKNAWVSLFSEYKIILIFLKCLLLVYLDLK